MGRSKSALRIWLEYLAFLPLLFMVRILPLRFTDRVAEVVGKIAFALLRRARERSVRHVLLAGLTESRSDARRLARQSFVNLAQTGIEFLKLDQFVRRFDARAALCGALRAKRDGKLEAALRSPKGLIVVGAHFGNWEVAGQLFSTTERPLSCVVRPLDNPKLNALLERWRERFHQKTVDKRGALKELLRVLRRGEGVALLVDQRANRAEGVMTTFFGRPALTHPAPALLHLKTEAPLVVGVAKRVSGCFNFEFDLRGPLEVERSGDGEADVRELAQLYTMEIESIIRADPEQWLWPARRWEETRGHRAPASSGGAQPSSTG